MILLCIQRARIASKIPFQFLLEKHDFCGKCSHWSLTDQVVQSGDAEVVVCARLVGLVYERTGASAGVKKAMPLWR